MTAKQIAKGRILIAKYRAKTEDQQDRETFRFGLFFGILIGISIGMQIPGLIKSIFFP